MKAGRTALILITFCLLLLLAYLASFYGIESYRHRQGPWVLQFVSDAAGTPAISITQPKLGITSATVVFKSEQAPLTNLDKIVTFDRPFKPVPFGKVLYQDLTSFPGVVSFNFFGHEVEVLPRTLIVNKKEVPWKTVIELELYPTNKPAKPLKAVQ
jgi:hypothetical protein